MYEWNKKKGVKKKEKIADKIIKRNLDNLMMAFLWVKWRWKTCSHIA